MVMAMTTAKGQEILEIPKSAQISLLKSICAGIMSGLFRVIAGEKRGLLEELLTYQCHTAFDN